MKKILIAFLFFTICNPIFANENKHNAIYDGAQIIYCPSESIWTTNECSDDKIILNKKLIEGAGSYSLYTNNDDSLAFALATNFEMISNGNLIIVDNNLLKYYKMIYNNGSYEQIPLTIDEIQSVFPEIEIFKISQLESDNKVWLHKPLGKKKVLLLVNDTEKCFHKINTKSKNVQDNEIKGLISFNRYGIFRFKHFGEYKGQLTFYIR